MDLKSARKIILTHLQSQKGPTNFKLIELIGGDLPLFERIKEELIFNDLAEDKKGAGLVYLGSEKVNDDKNTEIQSEQNTFQISGSVSHKVLMLSLKDEYWWAPEVETFTSTTEKDSSIILNQVYNNNNVQCKQPVC